MLQSILFLLVIACVFFLRAKLRETALARLSPTHQSLIALAILVLLLLALTGKLGLLIPLFGAVTAAFVALVSRLMPWLSPVLSRHLPDWIERIFGQPVPKERQNTGSGLSSVRTPYLEMTLDHRSGQLAGRIRQGPHEGDSLTDLSLQSLMELYAFYSRDDSESARLLVAFLEQKFGPRWNRGDEKPHAMAAAPQGMARTEALSILGLGPEASEEEIIAAHRKLMQRVHPDRGGSDYLASRINQAKDFLLGRSRH